MIRALEHVGISVRNLERSIEFYRTGFGMQVLAREQFGPDTEEGRYAAILGLPAPKGRMALMKLERVQLELFEFSHPEPEPKDANHPVSHHGISHFCLAVDDIGPLVERLTAAGARFHCPPLEFFGEGIATYGRDPDGNVFELVQRK